MQPHTGVDEDFPTNLLSDETAILHFIDTARMNGANEDTTFYIYSAWPRLEVFDDWGSSVVDDDETTTTYAREYFDHLINRVRAETTATVNMIPVGEVLHELDQRMEAGQVAGFSSISQFYRDTTHLTTDLGRYTAGVTTFATMFDFNPTGSTKPTNSYNNQQTGGAAFTPALYAAIHDAVWDVVSANAYRGTLYWPADFQSDGYVDETDLAILESSFGLNAGGDTDNDGETDGRDLLRWQRMFDGSGSQVVPLLAAVPEPQSILLLISATFGSCVCMGRSRR